MNMIKHIAKSTKKKLEHTLKLGMLFLKENLFVLMFVRFVIAQPKPLVIMRIIQNLLKSFGCVLHAIYHIIATINFALNDLARRLRTEMQKSELVCKVQEEESKNSSRLKNKVTKVTAGTNDAWIINLKATLA